MGQAKNFQLSLPVKEKKEGRRGAHHRGTRKGGGRRRFFFVTDDEGKGKNRNDVTLFDSGTPRKNEGHWECNFRRIGKGREKTEGISRISSFGGRKIVGTTQLGRKKDGLLNEGRFRL